jgi:hypothetical protein
VPRYAIVAVIEADQPNDAWEKVSGLLSASGTTRSEITYVGAPWNVPSTGERPVEFGTDTICLTLDGECVTLDPAD